MNEQQITEASVSSSTIDITSEQLEEYKQDILIDKRKRKQIQMKTFHCLIILDLM
jgi:hypothetical protein